MKKNFNMQDIRRNMSTKKNVQTDPIDILRGRIKRLRERLIWLRSLHKTT